MDFNSKKYFLQIVEIFFANWNLLFLLNFHLLLTIVCIHTVSEGLDKTRVET